MALDLDGFLLGPGIVTRTAELFAGRVGAGASAHDRHLLA